MSIKEIKDLLITFASEIKDLKKQNEVLKTTLDELKSTADRNAEVIETTYQRTEDVSKKFDELLNTGIKKPKPIPTKPTSTEVKSKSEKKSKASTNENPKVIKNILKYFKVKYASNENIFDDILEENQVSTVLLENAAKIDGKKNETDKQKERINLVYKSLTESQRNKIRARMVSDNDAISTNTNDDIELENNEIEES